jgi:hypothetical protein
MTHLITRILLAASILSASAPLAQAVRATGVAEQDGVKLDRDKVRYGDASQFDAKRGDKVGTVRSTEVYEAIPAYKTIKKEGVTEGSARWQQLMREATEAYKSALRTVASNQSLVIVVEEGGISGYGQVSDVTSSVIGAVGAAVFNAAAAF